MTESVSSGASREEERRRWLALLHTEHSREWRDTFRLSAHGLLLQLDVERAFVAGAWASTIVMAQAFIDRKMRQWKPPHGAADSKPLLGAPSDLEHIQALRDELVQPASTGGPSKLWGAEGTNYASAHAALEADARTAMQLMVAAVYA